MHDLFNTQLPMLKLNFYQMDRLIAILLPDLHSHFKDENVNSSYFSAPYFITLFTSTMQLQTSMDSAALLLRLWDYFIINGWKAIFKVSLAMLSHFEEQMLAMNFEVLLTQIVNIPTKYLVREYSDAAEESKAVQTFDKQVKGIKLPTMLLERLKKEFDENYEVSKRSRSISGGPSDEKPAISTPKSSGGLRSLFSSNKKERE